ncbi:MAG: hypothetical protein PHH98_01430 [Candidatus Gracilibacteria bacterium]|nr:hypothetical protein [Candidatus Gracilibacteria bacterium]
MKKTNYLAIVLLLALSFGISNANDDLDVTSSVSTSVKVCESGDDCGGIIKSESEIKSEDEIKIRPIPTLYTGSGVREKMKIHKAEDSEMHKSISGTGSREKMEGIKSEIKTFKKDIKEIRAEKKDEISENFKTMKENREEIKSEFSLKSVLKGLNSELNTEIKTLNDTFRADVKDLEDQIKDNVGDLVKVKELRLELQNLRVAYYEKLISLVTDSTVKAELTSRLDLMKQNFELINSNIDARIEYRGKLNDKVSTFKDTLSTKLEAGLPKVKEANIEKVLTKVDGILELIDKNTKISQTNKDKLMAQIIALKELLEEQLEANTQATLDVSTN